MFLIFFLLQLVCICNIFHLISSKDNCLGFRHIKATAKIFLHSGGTILSAVFFPSLALLSFHITQFSYPSFRSLLCFPHLFLLSISNTQISDYFSSLSLLQTIIHPKYLLPPFLYQTEFLT